MGPRLWYKKIEYCRDDRVSSEARSAIMVIVLIYEVPRSMPANAGSVVQCTVV